MTKTEPPTDRHSARVQLALQLATRPEDRAKALQRLTVPELLDLARLTIVIGSEAFAEVSRRPRETHEEQA